MLDWKTIMETASVAGVCFAALYFGFKLIVLFFAQWKDSTEAVNKNTGAFTQLSEVLERSNQREMQFQNRAIELLEANNTLAKDTNAKVIDIHRKIG